MTATPLRAAARVATPWKNGGGITREVAVSPEPEPGSGAAADGFDWRISLADVADDGPFSAFAGYHRVITVVRGAGMVLTVDGVEHVVDRPYEPFAFSGAGVTDCRLLGGPVVDFNVMTRIGAVEAAVEFAASPTTVAAPTAVVVVFEGEAVVTDAQGAERSRLTAPFDAVLLRDEADAMVVPVPGPAEPVVAVVRLRSR